jgi:hypothetical protein
MSDRVRQIETPGVRDRFCAAETWHDGVGLGPCGGQTEIVRRVLGDLLVTYCRCVFCGHLTRLLEHDLGSGEDRIVERAR